ncbi:hypothetical protein ACLOJK_022510 [Asimina triloba]
MVSVVVVASVEFVQRLLNYIEGVVIRIIIEFSEDYPQFQSLTKRAVHNLMDNLRDRGIEQMLEESLSIALKHDRLNKTIKLLKESKDVVAKIMDSVSASSDVDE